MANTKIREHLYVKRVHQWELAQALGYTDSTLVRHLRNEFPDDITQKICEVIDCIADGKTCDVTFYRQYMFSQNKRAGGRWKTAEQYSRYVARGLDEAERRRTEGGWDLSL